MTATETAASGSGAAAEPAAGHAGEGRSRLGLGTRIFLITSALIALAVGTAVVFTSVVSDRIARRAAEEDLGSILRLQDGLRAQFYDQRFLASYLFVSEPGAAAYLAESTTSANVASILDLLASRQADLGFDFAVVLDTTGRVVARTDRPGATGGDLSQRPLVAAALRDYEAFGVWREGDRLYRAVAVPISRGAQLLGFLVSAHALSADTATDLRRMSGTDVVYVTAGRQGDPRVVAGSLSPELEEGVLAGLERAGDGGGLASGEGEGETAELELELGGDRWIARWRPLRDAAGEVVGASIALAPLAPQLAPFRRIGRVLLASGAVAVLAALALTFAFARRTLAPVQELVDATAAARAGDYDHPIPVRRGDEVGELARAFDDLLSDLRERRDMEEYLADLSRTLPEPAAAPAPAPVEAERAELTVLLVELRGSGSGDGEPQQVLDRFSADVGSLAAAVAARGGSLMALGGHRLWLRFRGEGRTHRAFACAAELARAFLAEGRSLEAPAMALASGPAVTGAVRWGEERRATSLGRPLLRLESLAREASPGDVVLAPEVEAELRSTFESAGLEPVEQRGVFTGGTLFVVDVSTAASLASGHSLPTVVTGEEPTAAGPPTLSGIGPGSVVGGRFEILAVLGSGGMGVVYKARDRELDEVVAVKMLKTGAGEDLSTAAGRLREELRLARRITHPNVLRTYDLGEVAGIPFISMEYVRGVTLAQLLEHTERLAFSAGLSVAKQLCQGLAAAHAEGVLHRDIKPANLILQPNGNVKLMDFGIARRLRRSEPGHTVEGWLVGTPKYLSPEQLRGEEPDARADVYASGVVLYEMFTGASPFTGSSHAELVSQTLEASPPPPSVHWPEMPPELERILLRCLEKDPVERYPGAEALLADLSRLRA